MLPTSKIDAGITAVLSLSSLQNASTYFSATESGTTSGPLLVPEKA
jgi:hypothetical protein